MSARLSDVCLVEQGLISAYGAGVAACADGLMSGRNAFTPAGNRFAAPLAALPVGTVPRGVCATSSSPRFMALLQTLFAGLVVPPDARVYLATTVGEISALESEVMTQNGFSPAQRHADGADVLTRLPQRLAGLLGIDVSRVQVISSACASSTLALSLGASAIHRGEITCALVVGCDAVSEFVLSGFAALMAIDADGAKPFDADRRGVTLGEAAAFALLMSRERAASEGRARLGLVCGWGATCDANHLTGPSRDGLPLSDAVEAALRMAACAAKDVVAVCAHGTGTVYNDQMEMLAFKRVFGGRPVPLFSVKGGMGHTLGASGLAEVLLSLEFLRRGQLPPTVGLRRVSEDARGWATTQARPVSSTGVMLTTNSGFGGTNAAVALSVADISQAAREGRRGQTMRVAGLGRATSQETAPEMAPFVMPRNFGRFSAEARLAFYAVSRALRAAGVNPAGTGARVGIVAFDRDGCAAANRAYFSDYVQSGRVLGRGQLFVYTLPTSVAAECAIACRLKGPLVYVAEEDGGVGSAVRVADGLLAESAAEAVVLVTVTPGVATAFVVTADGPLSVLALAEEVEACSRNGC